MGEVLKILGPLVGSLVGVTVGMLAVRRRRKENVDWEPGRWLQWGFFVVVGVLMLIAMIVGLNAGKPRQWLPALVAVLLCIALPWFAEVARRKKKARRDLAADEQTPPAVSRP